MPARIVLSSRAAAFLREHPEVEVQLATDDRLADMVDLSPARRIVRGQATSTDGTVLRQALAGVGQAVLPWFMLAGPRRAQIGVFAVVAAARGLPLRVRLLLDHLMRWFSGVDWATRPRDRARRRRRWTSRTGARAGPRRSTRGAKISGDA